TKAGALDQAGSAAIDHRVEDCERDHGEEHAQHAYWHHDLHILLGSINDRIFEELPSHQRPREEQPAEREVRNHCTERRQHDSRIVHGRWDNSELRDSSLTAVSIKTIAPASCKRS